MEGERRERREERGGEGEKRREERKRPQKRFCRKGVTMTLEARKTGPIKIRRYLKVSLPA